MNPSVTALTGLQRELAQFSLSIEKDEPDASSADTLNRAIWHSVKGYATPYNHGRAPRRLASSSLSLLRLAGF